MPSLDIPVPTLKGASAGVAQLEKPLEVLSAEVTFPDGAAFGQTTLGTPNAAAGFFVYRQPSALLTQVFDENAKAWVADPGPAVVNLKPKPFVFQEGDPAARWQSLLVAVGQKDAAGADQFKKATGGFPRYFFRAFFAGEHGGVAHSGLSAPTAPVTFISALDAMRAGIKAGDDQTPENATEIVFFLRNSALDIIGSVEIRSEGGSARVEISNRDAAGTKKAVVRLLPNGDVEVTPAPGRDIIFGGPLNADRIFFQPANATGAAVGAKVWLTP
jgi:hypothetical protein